MPIIRRREPGEVTRKPDQPDLICPECGRSMPLVETCWPDRPWQYRCRCGVTHGCHPDGSPLGVPADRATRQARIDAHEVFDRLWRGGPLHRQQAYDELAVAMGVERGEAHFGSMSVEECCRAMAWAKVRLEYFRDSCTEGRVQWRGKWMTFKPGLKPKKRREIGE